MRTRDGQGEKLLRLPRFASLGSGGRRRVLSLLTLAVCVSAGIGAAIAFAKPEYTLRPRVESIGQPHVGGNLECRNGDWKPGPTEFEYQWVVEGTELGFKGQKQSILATQLTVKKEYENKEIWCEVRATVKGESEVAESENSICVTQSGPCKHEPPPVPPVNKEKPKVSGKGAVGETLACSQGTWTGTQPISYAYKWFRGKEEPISGATMNQYKVVEEDEGHKISCLVIATNTGGGEGRAESENSIAIPETPPKNTKAPEVVGVTYSVNETLECHKGTWTGTQPIKYTYKWFRNGAEIKAATESVYVVQPADEGQKISCEVTGENKQGKVAASSAAVTIAGALKSTGAPVITPGSAKVGTTLTCSEGSWNEPVSELKLKYEWLRESEPISGVTTNQYKVQSVDTKHLLYCRVFATNPGKEEAHSAVSSPVSIPGTGAPVEKTPPEVQGTPALGKTLTCVEGTWTNGPTSYVFQWLREGAAIGSATEREYVVKTADEGHKVSCQVIAENSEGPSEPADSAEVRVSGERPSSTTPPTIEGGTPTPRVGESLTCLHGEWKGVPTPTFTYKWLREGTEVAATVSYTIVSADRGHELACVVTATNVEAPGGVSATSNGLYVPGVLPEPPVEGPKNLGHRGSPPDAHVLRRHLDGPAGADVRISMAPRRQACPICDDREIHRGDRGSRLRDRLPGHGKQPRRTRLGREQARADSRNPARGPRTAIHPRLGDRRRDAEMRIRQVGR